jgi:hypothetical protein
MHVLSHLWKLGENKTKKQDHESKRGITWEVEGDGKGGERRELKKSNRGGEYVHYMHFWKCPYVQLYLCTI